MLRWIPLLFVLLWSTGFIGAAYALPWIEPFHLLFLRMLLTLLVFLVLIKLWHAPWPGATQAAHQMVVGLLVHAGYLGGVFAAIKWQLPAGVTALIVGLQPLLTALLAWSCLGQQLARRQWLGLCVGLLGVSLVLLSGLEGPGFVLEPWAVLAAILALLSISLGTLYQKRFGQGGDLLTGSFYQYLSTAVVMLILARSFEQGEITWHPQLILALLWLVLGLSVTAILLLMWMIRQGAVAKVATYFYLVPPLTVLEGWWLFDQGLGAWAWLGILLAVSGVYMALRQPVSRV